MDIAMFVLLVIVAAVGVTVWLKKRGADAQVDRLVSQAQSAGAVCSRAELVDGTNHIPVALRLEPPQITYRNQDLDAAIDIERIDEVEYGSDLMTGATAKGSVLRLRAHGRAIEFVLDPKAAERWSRELPAHQMNQAPGIQQADERA